MNVKVVCFDIDGTLYPSRVMKWRLLRTIFPSPALAFRYQRFRSRIRQETDVKTIPADRDGFRIRQARSILMDMGKKPEEKAVGKLTVRIERQFYSSFRRMFAKIRPYKGVREAMEVIKAKGCRIGVLSDFPIEGKLDALGVADLVDFSCCSEDSGYLKPHPEPFLYIARHMDVACSDILYVGDSYRKDVLGARETGMRTCLIFPKIQRSGIRETHGEVYPFADMVCTDYQDFMKQADTIFSGGA